MEEIVNHLFGLYRSKKDFQSELDSHNTKVVELSDLLSQIEKDIFSFESELIKITKGLDESNISVDPQNKSRKRNRQEPTQ